jgi:hypothetical protein
MNYPKLVAVALATSLLPSAAMAQRVVADVSIGSGPVAAHVIVGRPSPHYPRRVVVYPMHRGRDGWRDRNYREVRVWYDQNRDCYYDRGDQYRDGFREVVIYQRDGRFYDRDFGRQNDRDRQDGHRADRGRDDGHRADQDHHDGRQGHDHR